MKKDSARLFKKKLILASTTKHYNDPFKPTKFGYETVDERKMKREKSANKYKDSFIRSGKKEKKNTASQLRGLQISSTQDLTGSCLKQYGDGKSLYTPNKKVPYVSKTKATSGRKRLRR